ncbi:MAG TPA: trypsin-like peptidase domain-containing protein [Gemmatimonadales bacterium]
MKAQFTIQSGSRAGQIDVLSQPFILVGRHPQCELRFDADQDLDVSARHASITLAGKLYVLRDLGSTNGTLVNGNRLTGDHVLATKDVIQFGTSGPRVEFASIPDPPPSAMPASRAPAPAETGAFLGASAPPQVLIPPSGSPGSFKLPRPTPGGAGATTRIKIEVQKQTKKHRTVQYVLFAMLLLVTGAYFWSNSLNERRLVAQRELLLGQVDSLVTQIGTMTGTNQVLQDALDSAKTEAERLKQRINASGATGPEIEQLRAQLKAATQQQRNLAQVAALDGAAIAAANQEAVALVFVQFPDGRTFTGTAFAIQSDQNGGLLVTNRHVVVDSAGRLPDKVGVVFNGSNQNFRADVAAIGGPEADVALLKTSVHRGVPVVKGIATSRAEVGEPVAVLGFPMGLDLQKGPDWRQEGVAATLTLGTVSRTLPDLLQLDSYGAQGSSGSPIFNRAGMVVGLVYGGEKGSNGRIVYGVPAGTIKELLLHRE